MQKTPRQKLKIINTPPHYRVHHLALEAYLAQAYHLTNFSVLKATGATHGDHLEYLVHKKIPTTLLVTANQIREGGHGDLALILTVLCADGHIPAGKYIINTHREIEPLEIYKKLLQTHLDPMHKECITFKAEHREDTHFRKMARVIDRSLTAWLKTEQSEERPEEL